MTVRQLCNVTEQWLLGKGVTDLEAILAGEDGQEAARDRMNAEAMAQLGGFGLTPPRR
jgi:hypothetical protein